MDTKTLIDFALFTFWIISLFLIFSIYEKVSRIEVFLKTLDEKIEEQIAISGHIVQVDMLSDEFRKRVHLIAKNSGKQSALTAIGEMLGADRSKSESIFEAIIGAGS